MELINHTGLPAALARTAIDDETLMGAAVAVRVTYDYRDGALAPSEEQSWAISLEALETWYGPLDGADPFGRGGVDVFALGLAHAPGGRSLVSMEVAFEIDRWRHAVRVVGDRRWVRVGDELVPSAPAPFTVMPLALPRAFGGKSHWDGLEVPYGNNPEGIGFYIDAAQAEGSPLPNLELVDQAVRRWSDQPEPAGMGFCPMSCSLRVRNGATFNEKTGEIQDVHPLLFNAAYPKMIAPAARPGMRVRASGIDVEGPWDFALPDAPARLRVIFDDEVIDAPLDVSQIGLETEFRRVFITWRHAFRYHVYPRQKRSCELLPVAPELGASAP